MNTTKPKIRQEELDELAYHFDKLTSKPEKPDEEKYGEYTEFRLNKIADLIRENMFSPKDVYGAIAHLYDAPKNNPRAANKALLKKLITARVGEENAQEYLNRFNKRANFLTYNVLKAIEKINPQALMGQLAKGRKPQNTP